MLLLMRRFLILVVVLSLTLLACAQSSPSFLVKLRMMKADLPRSDSTTCLAVFPGGKFHLEEDSYVQHYAKPYVFEDSLPLDSLSTLSALLEADDLKELQMTDQKFGAFAQGEVVWALIPRGNTSQRLIYVGIEGSGTQHPKPLPPPLRPLVSWFETTVKDIDHRKLQPLRKAKGSNCDMFSRTARSPGPVILFDQ